MTDSLKIRLIIVIVTLNLVPVIPLSFILQDFTSKLLELTLDRRIEGALDDAMELARTMINRDRNAGLKLTRELSQSIAFVSWLRRSAGSASTVDAGAKLAVSEQMEQHRILRLTVHTEPSSVLEEITSKSNKSPVVPLDSQFIAERLIAANEYSQYYESHDVIVAAVPILLPNTRRGLLVTQLAAGTPYSKQTGEFTEALRYVEELNKFRPRLEGSFVMSFLLLYAVVAGLSIVLGVLFSVLMVRPINSLLTGTRQISSGNWDYQIPLNYQSREFRELAESFNAMVVRIREEKDRALHLEKMAAWREIAQRLAHEIKNPLTPIQLMAQQIRDTYKGDDNEFKRKLDEATEIIQEEISNLRNLTREFSEFARLPVLTIRKCRLNQILKDLRALYSDHRVDIELDEALPEMDLDPDAIKRVLINLLDNALTAIDGRPDGRVHVKANRIDDRVRITLTDTGHGISRENLARIFEPHFSTKKSSMGLGLAIVKSILDEHQATITAESVENLGTSFTIDLQINKPSLLESL